MTKDAPGTDHIGMDAVLERVVLAGDIDFDWIGRVVVAHAMRPVLDDLLHGPQHRPRVIDVEALLRISVRTLDDRAEICCVCQREGPDNIVVCRGSCC